MFGISDMDPGQAHGEPEGISARRLTVRLRLIQPGQRDLRPASREPVPHPAIAQRTGQMQ